MIITQNITIDYERTNSSSSFIYIKAGNLVVDDTVVIIEDHKIPKIQGNFSLIYNKETTSINTSPSLIFTDDTLKVLTIENNNIISEQLSANHLDVIYHEAVPLSNILDKINISALDDYINETFIEEITVDVDKITVLNPINKITNIYVLNHGDLNLNEGIASIDGKVITIDGNDLDQLPITITYTSETIKEK